MLLSKVQQRRARRPRCASVRAAPLESLEDRVVPSIIFPGPPGLVEAHGQVRVMTYNIDEGSDFNPLLAVRTAQAVPGAVSAVLAEVQASDIPGRAQALAAEIAAAQPDLLGLQEVTVWTVNGATRYDLLGSLLGALAADGQHYRVVVSSPEFGAAAPDAAGDIVGFQDDNVILARTDLPVGFLRLSNAQEGQFAAHVTLPLPGLAPITLPRSWASVDVEMRGEQFRFITTHLETLSPAVNEAQADELLAGPAHAALPVILTGDFNAPANDSATYSDVIAAGFLDAWGEAHPGDPGQTGSQKDLADPILALDRRIDFVFADGGIQVESATLVGTDPAFRTASGLWPSDHLGLLVTLDLPPFGDRGSDASALAALPSSAATGAGGIALLPVGSGADLVQAAPADVDALFASFPGSSVISANALGNQAGQASTPVLEAAMQQWLLSQQATALPGSVVASPSLAAGPATDSPTDGSPCSHPFAVSFNASPAWLGNSLSMTGYHAAAR